MSALTVAASHARTRDDVPYGMAPPFTYLPTVVADLSYLHPTSERPYNYMYQPPAGVAWHNVDYDARAVRIADARWLVEPPSVHREGHVLRDAPSAVRNFGDEAAIRSIYYPEVAELACAVTGGSRAFVFDHQLRKREPDRRPLTFGRQGDGSRPAAVGRVHNDYSEASGLSRMQRVMAAAGEHAVVERFCIVNVWRSIKGPVLDTPLAVCDARTVSATDLVPAEVRYPDRTGEIYLVSYAPSHRWVYYAAMDRHEALVFKQYDSQVSGVARFTPHAAFDHPDMPPDAPLRESIEARCLVLFE